MFIDPLYLLFAAPGMLLGLWAQFKVKRAFSVWSDVPTARGETGAQVAAAILRVHRIGDVRIEPVGGFLSDHYDPTSKTLRLSPDVFHGRSVAAAGIAAHEVGHAIQHAQGYAWLQLRSQLVPALGVTSTLALPMFFGGLVLSAFAPALGQLAIVLGLVGFFSLVVFQVVTLPVEFDASRRALAAIDAGHLVSGEEYRGAKQVLDAAALTYVAAAVSSLMTFLYWLLQSGLLGRRDD